MTFAETTLVVKVQISVIFSGEVWSAITLESNTSQSFFSSPLPTPETSHIKSSEITFLKSLLIIQNSRNLGRSQQIFHSNSAILILSNSALQNPATETGGKVPYFTCIHKFQYIVYVCWSMFTEFIYSAKRKCFFTSTDVKISTCTYNKRLIPFVTK